MWTYAAVEKLLAGLYGAADADVQKGAFRGRLKHLKRLGVPLDSAPGTGAKIQYEFEHLCQWSFCLELEEFGMDPSAIVALLQFSWQKLLAPAYRRARRDLAAGNDMYVTVRPELMSKEWSARRNKASATGVARIGVTQRNDIRIHLDWLEDDDGPRRIGLFNISKVVRAIAADEEQGQ